MTVQLGERLGWMGPITQVDSSRKEMLGIQRVELDHSGNRKMYRYVKNAEASTAFASGELLKWDDASAGEAKRSAAQGDLLCGVAISAITAGSFGWVQIYGLHAGIKSAASTAAGDAMIASGTAATCGRVAKNTAPTNQVGAWATAARNDTAGTNAGLIVIGG